MKKKSTFRRFIHENGLSLALLGLFALSYIGLIFSGWSRECNHLVQIHKDPISLIEYLRSGGFWEATFENWESEFLQMAMYIALTAFLIQKGSAESNPPAGKPGIKSAIQSSKQKFFYEHSLSLVLAILFLISFVGHLVAGVHAWNAERLENGQAAVSLLHYASSSQFWFESFQNWQSEFLSIGVLVLLSIFLREKGSSQSKRVTDSNSKTGAD